VPEYKPSVLNEAPPAEPARKGASAPAVARQA
jgi:hypothetical protein